MVRIKNYYDLREYGESQQNWAAKSWSYVYDVANVFIYIIMDIMMSVI